MSSELAIKIENVSKCYHIYDRPRDRLRQLLAFGGKKHYREFWALKDVSFAIPKGETVGVIGRNGSGKSTLLQLICGTLEPTSGSIVTNGRIAALLELGAGFNPEFTGRENVYMSCTLLGMSNQEIDDRFDDIASFADIGNFLDQPVKTYSSGMFVRLAFSVNIMSQPEIMVVDEALAVGDMNFQAKCMTALTRIQANGATVLFVSHDIGAVKNFCSKAIYLERGSVLAMGKAPDVSELYTRFMREGLNKEHKEFLDKQKLIEKLKGFSNDDPLLVNEKVNFKRSDDFDKRVAISRYGSGGTIVSYVEILDLQNQPLSVVEFNQEVKINIYIESQVNNLITVYFGILDMKRNQITGAGLRHLDLPLIEVKSGEKYVVCFKTKLPLEDGNYSVMAQLSRPIAPDQSADFIDVVNDAVVFSIERRPHAKLWAKVYLFPTCEIKRVYE